MTETTILEPTAILRRASNILAVNGRTIGGYYTELDQLTPDQCPVCVIGAINLACGLEPDDTWTLIEEAERVPRIRAAVAATTRLAQHLGLVEDFPPSADFLLEMVGDRWHDGASDGVLFAALAAASESEAS